ncbi:2Fe-2S iron-sulfur cluster-binding protein [Nocardia sp. NPDC052278]|uniref:2Fe-2S iron-sulfur cluster-binding protein n=1 Tax=unclassified Nocardia TaxID=2637762 RepID=UPI0036AFF72B
MVLLVALIPALAVKTEPSAARGLHRVRITRVVQETPDTRSFVLEVPPRYAYRAGQFLTFRVVVDGQEHYRSYSLSSAPAVDALAQVTVKRMPGGVVSNWMNDVLTVGDEVETSTPAGGFVLDARDGEVVAFAGGSGITPVFSIVKTVLATSPRRVRLLYANRDHESVIFRRDLVELAERYGPRFAVTFHHDCDADVVDRATIEQWLDTVGGETAGDAEYFVCGPEPFMELVESVLATGGVDTERVHSERFTPVQSPPSDVDTSTPAELTIRCGRTTTTGTHRPGATILQTARALGLRPPSSCEAGSCATCIAQVVEGSAAMRHNEALTPDEVADGWVLTCQAFPIGPVVRVVYE